MVLPVSRDTSRSDRLRGAELSETLDRDTTLPLRSRFHVGEQLVEVPDSHRPLSGPLDGDACEVLDIARQAGRERL